jgi:hypothetical protein
MPPIRSPGVLLKLWQKAKEAYEKKQKPELLENGQKEKTGIKTGLAALRDLVKKGVKSQESRTAFSEKQNLAVKALMRYCKFLKTAKDPDKTKLANFLKTLKKLTVAVKLLSVETLEDSDEEIGLAAIDDLRTDELDKELEGGESEGKGETTSPDASPPPPAQPVAQTAATPPPQGGSWARTIPTAVRSAQKRLDMLSQGIAATRGHKLWGSKITTLVSEIQQAINLGDAPKAGELLTQLEPMIKEALKWSVKPSKPASRGQGPSDSPEKPPAVVSTRVRHQQVEKLKKNCAAATILLKSEGEKFCKEVQKLQATLKDLGDAVPDKVVDGLNRVMRDMPEASRPFREIARIAAIGEETVVGKLQDFATEALDLLDIYVHSDPLVLLVCQNPFQAVDITPLNTTIATVRQSCLKMKLL